MKRPLLILLIMLLPAIPAYSGESALEGVGFREKVFSPGTDFKRYAEFSIYGIDVRGMVVTRIDTDGDSYRKSADDDILSGIAVDLGRAFSVEMSKVVPLAQQEKQLKGLNELKGRNVLVLDITMRYDRKVENVGALTQLLRREKETVVSDKGLTIECVFRDADSGKIVLRLDQTQAFDVENNDQPFATVKDQEELGKLINLWAARAAHVIAAKRSMM